MQEVKSRKKKLIIRNFGTLDAVREHIEKHHIDRTDILGIFQEEIMRYYGEPVYNYRMLYYKYKENKNV